VTQITLRDRLTLWAHKLSLWTLAGLLVTLPFWRHRVLIHRPGGPIFFEFLDITLYTNDLVWLATLGAWLLSWMLGRRPRTVRLGPWFLFGPLAGLFVLSLAGIPLAVDPVVATYHAVRQLLLLGLYLQLVNMPLSTGIIAWSFAAGVAIQAVVAVPQFVLRQSLGLERLGEVSVQAAWPGASVVMVGSERWLRAYGLAQHPNLLGGCMMVMLLVMTGYYLRQSTWRRFLMLAAIGLALATLLLTFSRAAWLGTLLGGAILIGLLALAHRRGTWSWPRSSVALLGALSLGLVLTFVLLNWPLLQPRLGLTSQGVEIRSVDDRQMQVGAALTLIQRRPVLGVGLGNYPIALYQLAPETVSEYPVFQPVYNVLLLSAAEAGLGGGLLWVTMVLAPWLALWVRRRALQVDAWWAGLSGALAGLTLVSVFDFYPWSSHQGTLLLWIIWALWAREWTHSPVKEVQA
jgi:O-antigen ligase